MQSGLEMQAAMDKVLGRVMSLQINLSYKMGVSCDVLIWEGCTFVSVLCKSLAPWYNNTHHKKTRQIVR